MPRGTITVPRVSPDDMRGRPLFGAAARALWRFAPGVTYLNHGAFGATPTAVMVAQTAWRDLIETAPGPFLVYELPVRLRAAAESLARRFGGDGAAYAFVDNATSGVNAVLRSFPLRSGEAVLLTNHSYGAVRNAAAYTARVCGAALHLATIPFPLTDPGALLSAIEKALTPQVRLVILDHIVSETAQIWPMQTLIARCKAAGAAVLVDGAHAPGQIVLNVPALGADWYTGNLHKWAFAPRGSAFLWASPTAPYPVHPTVISWGLDQGFSTEFDWVGTRDPSAWLSAPAGLDFMDRFGAETIRSYNNALTDRVATMLATTWQTPILAPLPGLVGAMRLVALPPRFAADDETARRIGTALWQQHRIHAAIMRVAERLWLRISAQIYNDEDDFARLAAVVLQL